MSEEVLISFTPTQWKYYYDTIKIVGPDINVTVPIHGYIKIQLIFSLLLYRMDLNNQLSLTLPLKYIYIYNFFK